MVVVCLGCSGPPCLSGRNPVMASIAGSMGCARSKEDDQILASIGRVWFNKQKQNEILPWSQEGTKLKTPFEGTGRKRAGVGLKRRVIVVLWPVL